MIMYLIHVYRTSKYKAVARTPPTSKSEESLSVKRNLHKKNINAVEIIIAKVRQIIENTIIVIFVLRVYKIRKQKERLTLLPIRLL